MPGGGGGRRGRLLDGLSDVLLVSRAAALVRLQYGLIFFSFYFPLLLPDWTSF